MDPTTAAYQVLQLLRQRTETDALARLYPDTGSLARDNYIKHIKMFAAGIEHTERVCMGGNRVGKTLSIGGYELAVHLTGMYPHWWPGWTTDKPILAWACGTKSTKVRDVNQKVLLGALHQMTGYTTARGGLIPAARIGRLTRKSGVADAVDQVIINHIHGHENVLTLKSYEEGRTSFEAEGVDFIWLDEECDKGIYDECHMRILTTHGRMLSTFTPIKGMTDTVIAMLEDTDFL